MEDDGIRALQQQISRSSAVRDQYLATAADVLESNYLAEAAGAPHRMADLRAMYDAIDAVIRDNDRAAYDQLDADQRWLLCLLAKIGHFEVLNACSERVIDEP